MIMKGLPQPVQLTIVRVLGELQNLPGLVAVALGGSYARGRARPDSDIDIALYYRETNPFDIAEVRKIAGNINDTPDPVVTGFGEWGPWVDGGAWLTTKGQRVDLLYRAIDKIEATLAEAQAGRFEIHFEQQPPFGFFGPTILGELAIAQLLMDQNDILAALKARVSPIPDALVRAVVQSRLWSVEFGLMVAQKHIMAANVVGVAGCITRFASALILTIFALNRTYLINDKTALAEIQTFPISPKNFGPRLNDIVSEIGADQHAISLSLAKMTDLFEETRLLAVGMYKPYWKL
jgi:hypothetical protein